MTRPLAHAALLAAAALLGACASAGSTFRSGVGDTMLAHPPYYAGAAVDPSAGRAGHLPIAYQRGAAQAPIFDPRDGADTPVGRLLGEMNAYLDSLSIGPRLVEGGQVSAVAHAATRQPPDVQFGCLTEGNLPGEDCAARGDSALGRGDQRMRLAVGRPSAEWTAWMRDVARENRVDRVLVVTLEVGQYLPRQTGLRGDKEVELGTGNVARLPWLTSLETPVLVLQLTGALVDTTGRAIRIGAEGFHPVRTRLAVSGVGGQALLKDADVEAARTVRREDLAGQPLAWRVALGSLVAQLTGARR
jgi:hypothetical protein